ncbi:uncharacterized protein LOC122384132 isoform X1 [Amphibalanus amphitrite]|uniref:uncharacterized protein LOC122384132 isoform X1 n=1 Tax=Amphibalanus amphitrite TaxID=1232801 RepID=UPI001C900212|nr:uncharacterized protein LOC122384132 isoform X1 [Amphibalanus amphitrite]
MSAATVADVLVNQFIARFGCPRRIHSDNAANFSGSLLAEVCRLLGVEKSFSSAFHPEGNSKCERMMRTILDMLAKYLDANHTEWDVHIPLLMLGYRAKVHSSLGHSPYYLMFGRNPRLPASVQIQAPSTAPKTVTIADYLSKLTERIKLSHKVALEASNRRHARNKRLFDKKLTTYSFQEGDPVYLFRSVAKSGQYYKFIRPWKPAVIVKNLSELNYRVRLLGGKKSVVVHHNRLKPRDDDPSVPVAAPNMSIPSTVVSPCTETDVQLPSRPSPLPRFAALGGDSYLPPFRGRADSGPATEALPDRDGEVGEPLLRLSAVCPRPCCPRPCCPRPCCPRPCCPRPCCPRPCCPRPCCPRPCCPRPCCPRPCCPRPCCPRPCCPRPCCPRPCCPRPCCPRPCCPRPCCPRPCGLRPCCPRPRSAVRVRRALRRGCAARCGEGAPRAAARVRRALRRECAARCGESAPRAAARVRRALRRECTARCGEGAPRAAARVRRALRRECAARCGESAPRAAARVRRALRPVVL